MLQGLLVRIRAYFLGGQRGARTPDLLCVKQTL